jgi:FlaA1/EpsC-like NDP-sugar epimerase
MLFGWWRRAVGGQALFDTVAWFLAVFLAFSLRFEFDLGSLDIQVFILLATGLALAGYVAGYTYGLYRSRFAPGSFDDLLTLGIVAAVAGFPFALGTFFFGPDWGIPRSVVLIAAPLFLLISGASRALRRYWAETFDPKPSGKRALIYGAGKMAESLIPQLLKDPSSKFLPVGLLDDDPYKANRWISGVKMKGPFDQLKSIVPRVRPEVLIVAFAGVTSTRLREIRASAVELGLEIFVLPSFSEILSSQGKNLVLRNLGIEDLVGRRAVTVDSPEIGLLLEGKTVLITGAGGSIGSELCRQVASHGPRRLLFLDRDETGLQHAQLVARQTGLLDDSGLILADIRDFEAVNKIFGHHKPDVVFHAAALKHLPVLENFPEEAWKTNVEGTLNVLRASRGAGVQHFVNISTDKAADPSSVLGRSKRLAEELTAWASTDCGGTYLSVRFGNVLGSRGSLVPTLTYLIDNDLPIKITHPDATRYFMTIPEACQLVLQASTEKRSDSIFLLDMGDPVRVMDVVERMIELSGKQMEVTFTGLRPGEKLHEILHSAGETLEKSNHDLIWQVPATSRHPDELSRLGPGFLLGDRRTGNDSLRAIPLGS